MKNPSHPFLVKCSFVALLAVIGLCSNLSVAATAQEHDEEPLLCSQLSDAVPADIPGRPVVYVHGWMSSAASAQAPARALQEELGSAFEVFAFDYRALNSVWPVGTQSDLCLAQYIEILFEAHQAAGGAGGVLGVGHSMGGIALRSASGQLESRRHGEMLAGLVTLGTPHHGSPLGGNIAATVLQELGRILVDFTPDEGLVAGGSSAALCLSAPRPQDCGIPDYLPDSAMIGLIGTQITIQRRLFDMPIGLDSADIRIFGDGIVPVDSAQGYANSGLGTSSGEIMASATEECTVSASYLSWSRLIKSTSNKLLFGTTTEAVRSWIAMWADHQAMDGFDTNTFNIAQVPLLALALESECFHSRLTTYDPVVHETANLLMDMNGRLPANSSDSIPGRRFWLHQLSSDGPGISGSRIQARLGKPQGEFLTQSTAQAIKCSVEPQATTYSLDGGYSQLRATVGLHVPTPGAGATRWRFIGNGSILAQYDLQPGETQEIQLSLLGLEELTVDTLTGHWGSCPAETYALGVLGNASVQELAQPGESDSETLENADDPAAVLGWPTHRNDAPPAFQVWFGAAATQGLTNVTVLRWSACSADICIGGDGDLVAIVRRGAFGWEPVAEFAPVSPAREVLNDLDLPDDIKDGILSK